MKKLSYYFFKKRLLRDNLFALVLSLLIIGFIFLFFFFGAAIGNLVILEDLIKFDHQLHSYLLSARTPELINFFLLITSLASTSFAVSVSIVFVILLFFKKKKNYLLPFFISLLGGMLTNFLSKFLIRRLRPIEPVYTEISYSFPSAHSTLAVVLYGFIFYYFWKQAKKRATKNLILVFGILLILAIGFSRIYLGVHFFSDVVGGYLLGLAWLCGGIGLAQWRLKRRIQKMIIT